MTSSVQTLIAKLAQHDITAEWGNTGGNCMALTVALPDGELLITDAEGPFTPADFDSDEERYGWCLGRYVNGDDGYPYTEAEMVEGGRDYAYLTTDLGDIDGMVDAVRTEVARKIVRA
jgi:hypothetical protein